MTTTTAPDVGIDDLNVYGSTLAVDARAIHAARGTPVETADKLQLLRRSLPPPWEDPVTMAVNAARPLVDRPDAFALLIVATESGVDYAKPLSAYVHRHLRLSERAFHLEVKHACFGATAALQLAAAWVASHPDQRALVVATDMARRICGHPAEPVEGAGAVALAVSAEPRVLALAPHRGFASREVYDVRRPTSVLEVSDADLSLAAYLDLLEIAWDGYARAAGPGALARLDHLVFHTPIAGLVRQAYGLLTDPDGDAPNAAAGFDRQVAPSLRYCRELGNVYSGSLYAALAGLVDGDADGDPDRAHPLGHTVGLYAYGSGSGACYFAGRLADGARERVARHRIGRHLAERRICPVPTYERIVEAHEQSLTEPAFVPDRALAPPGHFDDAYAGRGRLVLDRVTDFHRSYTWS